MSGSATSSPEEKAALYKVGNWLVDNRLWVSLITIAFTAFMAYEASKLQMFTSFGELLPYNHPFVAVHNKYSQQFGGANNITIMFEVKDGTIFNKDTLTKIFKATQDVDVLPGRQPRPDRLDRPPHDPLPDDAGRLDLLAAGHAPAAGHGQGRRARSSNIVHYSENIHGILVSLDDKAALIRANFHEGRVDYRQIFYDVNEQDHRAVPGRQHADLGRRRAASLRLDLPLFERRVLDPRRHLLHRVGAALDVLPRLARLAASDDHGRDWPRSGASAFINLIGFALDPLMLVMPFLITARAVSHAIQMHDRYYEEYLKNDWHKRKAIVAAFAELFVPTFSGIVTDALGVLVILLIPVVMLQKLAITASWWILAITVSEVLLNPIVYYYLRAPEPEMVILREEGLFKRFMDRVTDLTLSKAGRDVDGRRSGFPSPCCPRSSCADSRSATRRRPRRCSGPTRPTTSRTRASSSSSAASSR